MGRTILIFLLLGVFSFSKAQVFDFIIDKDGNGDFTTITEAITNIPDNSDNKTLFFIKNGLYEEKIHMPASKKNVSFIGESAEGVIFSWGDYQGKDGMFGAESYTFLSEGEDFYMENITVVNSYGVGSQAVAIRTTGDKQIYKNCIFKGHQDTYYAHKNRQYNFKCHIEGTVDFIYGDATAVFDSCSIHSLASGYVTAPADSKMISQLSDGKFIHGYLFKGCNITASQNVADNSVYLGRPWQSDASCVYINCTLGKHITPKGWNEWSDNNHLSAVFGEYNSKNPDGTLVDISQRAEWSRQLTEQEVNTRYLSTFFLRKSRNNWLAQDIAVALHAPLSVEITNNNLTWEAVDNAIGYAIYYDQNLLAFSKENNLAIDSENSNLEKIKVLTINEYGAMSDGSEIIPEQTGITNSYNTNMDITLNNSTVYFKEEVNATILNLSGTILISKNNTYSISLNSLNKGVYVVVAKSKSGKKTSEKIILK